MLLKLRLAVLQRQLRDLASVTSGFCTHRERAAVRAVLLDERTGGDDRPRADPSLCCRRKSCCSAIPRRRRSMFAAAIARPSVIIELFQRMTEHLLGGVPRLAAIRPLTNVVRLSEPIIQTPSFCGLDDPPVAPVRACPLALCLVALGPVGQHLAQPGPLAGVLGHRRADHHHRPPRPTAIQQIELDLRGPPARAPTRGARAPRPGPRWRRAARASGGRRAPRARIRGQCTSSG